MIALRTIVLASFVPAFAACSGPLNVDFYKGEPGQIPEDWNMPRLVLRAGYRSELRHKICRTGGNNCVYLRSPFLALWPRSAELQQRFDPTAYIGKTLNFWAWMRRQPYAKTGAVQIRMRVDYPNHHVEFFDSREGPVTSTDWQLRQVQAEVRPGAVRAAIWFRYTPRGPFEVADAAFSAVSTSVANRDAASADRFPPDQCRE